LNKAYPPGLSAQHTDNSRARVAAVPDMTIAELRDWLRTVRGISASHAVMWETLKRLGSICRSKIGSLGRVSGAVCTSQ